MPLLVSAGAQYDETRQYRYRLWRNFVAEPRDPCLWIMLNPSTATEYVDDPTVRKCQEFSRRWGHDSCRVVNIFAWRSTNPAILPLLDDPVGPDNDAVIVDEVAQASRIVCAWGNWGWVRDRGRAVRRLIRPYQTYAFNTTKSGEPIHPLYQPYAAPLVSFP